MRIQFTEKKPAWLRYVQGVVGMMKGVLHLSALRFLIDPHFGQSSGVGDLPLIYNVQPGSVFASSGEQSQEKRSCNSIFQNLKEVRFFLRTFAPLESRRKT